MPVIRQWWHMRSNMVRLWRTNDEGYSPTNAILDSNRPSFLIVSDTLKVSSFGGRRSYFEELGRRMVSIHQDLFGNQHAAYWHSRNCQESMVIKSDDLKVRGKTIGRHLNEQTFTLSPKEELFFWRNQSWSCVWIVPKIYNDSRYLPCGDGPSLTW